MLRVVYRHCFSKMEWVFGREFSDEVYRHCFFKMKGVGGSLADGLHHFFKMEKGRGFRPWAIVAKKVEVHRGGVGGSVYPGGVTVKSRHDS